eukprot:scaffold55124_cov15-Tisochrysis_lutea.AAC.1
MVLQCFTQAQQLLLSATLSVYPIASSGVSAAFVSRRPSVIHAGLNPGMSQAVAAQQAWEQQLAQRANAMAAARAARMEQ